VKPHEELTRSDVDHPVCSFDCGPKFRPSRLMLCYYSLPSLHLTLMGRLRRSRDDLFRVGHSAHQ
jgi:hypothetical protein